MQPSQVLMPMVGQEGRVGVKGQGAVDGNWTSEKDWVGWR